MKQIKEIRKEKKVTTMYQAIFKKVFLIGTFLQCIFLSVPSFALENTKKVTGTKSLLGATIGVILGIEALIVTVLFMKELVAYKLGDEQEKPKHAKAAKNTIILGILVMTASGIITAVFSYYV